MSIIDNLSEKQKEKILEITSHDAKECIAKKNDDYGIYIEKFKKGTFKKDPFVCFSHLDKDNNIYLNLSHRMTSDIVIKITPEGIATDEQDFPNDD